MISDTFEQESRIVRELRQADAYRRGFRLERHAAGVVVRVYGRAPVVVTRQGLAYTHTTQLDVQKRFNRAVREATDAINEMIRQQLGIR